MNGRGVWRRTAIAIAAVASGAVIAMPAVAAPARQRIDIPAQDLGTALTELARRADREIYFSSDLTSGRHARHLRGEFTVEQALNRLLAGSPLGFRRPSLRIPDVAFQVFPLPAHEPWMTGTLVYLHTFWDHDCVGLR